MAENDTDEGFCHICGRRVPVVGVTPSEALIIEEDATCVADYFLTLPHTNQHTGGLCSGGAKTPDSLVEIEDYVDDGLLPGDIEEDEWPENNEHPLYRSQDWGGREYRR